MTDKNKLDKKDDEFKIDGPTRTETMGLYMCLVCGLAILIAGLAMTFTGSSSTGWSPGGRFSAGRPGTINGTAAIVLAIVMLSVGLYGLRKRFPRSK